MDTTQALLILMPLAIGLQTFWIAHALNGLRGDLTGVRGDVNNLRGDVDNLRGDIKSLGDELHAHELGCQKRSQEIEVRLDRLEREPT